MKDKDGIHIEITDFSENVLDELQRRLPSALIAAGQIVQQAAADNIPLDEELSKNCMAAIERILKGND